MRSQLVVLGIVAALASCNVPLVTFSVEGTQPSEDCNAVGDEDGNGLADCTDPACADTSACKSVCGNGKIEVGEQCDDGSKNGAYGFCNSTCSALGPRCGDGVVNGPEACDSGSSNGGYGFCNTSCSGLGPRCGDRVVNGPEMCDTGTAYSSSMPAGVCRPDCAGTVQQRLIGVTANRVAPAQGGVAGADAICRTDLGASYIALLVDGTNRTASTSPYSGNGQVGWVLQPYTRYVSLETGALVFITDQTRLLGGVNGQPVGLYSPIHTDDGWGAWTGVNGDWTAGPDCLNWASNSSGDTGRCVNTAATSSGTFPDNGGISNCAQTRRFLCVQQ